MNLPRFLVSILYISYVTLKAPCDYTHFFDKRQAMATSKLESIQNSLYQNYV